MNARVYALSAVTIFLVCNNTMQNMVVAKYPSKTQETTVFPIIKYSNDGGPLGGTKIAITGRNIVSTTFLSHTSAQNDLTKREEGELKEEDLAKLVKLVEDDSFSRIQEEYGNIEFRNSFTKVLYVKTRKVTKTITIHSSVKQDDYPKEFVEVVKCIDKAWNQSTKKK